MIVRLVEAHYENGLRRPLERLGLRPGERVRLIVIRRPDPGRWDLARGSPVQVVDLNCWFFKPFPSRNAVMDWLGTQKQSVAARAGNPVARPPARSGRPIPSADS